jgi:hypothetical protein
MKRIRVQGALPGATVEVSAGGTPSRVVAKGSAAGGDDSIPLVSGVTLSGGERLSARQTLGSDASPPSPPPLEIKVAAAPGSVAELGFIGARSHMYQCGTAVWLTGAFPGAEARVAWGGAVHGSATAGPDGARVSLDAPLPLGPVELSQVAPVGAGPKAVVRTDRVPIGDTTVLPAPTITAPLVACQTATLVTGVFDGATVTLTHADGRTDVAAFDMSALWLNAAALRDGDKLKARQEMARCELKSPDSSPPVPVGPASALPAPTVVAPLCAGAVGIRVAGVVPGGLVHLKAGSTTYTGMAPPTANWADFFVPPLAAGKVSATQEACGFTSPPPTRCRSRTSRRSPSR